MNIDAPTTTGAATRVTRQLESRRLTRPQQCNWIPSQTFVTKEECDYVFAGGFSAWCGGSRNP